MERGKYRSFNFDFPPPLRAPFPDSLLKSSAALLIFPGMSPANIKDNKLRTEYKKAINQNNEKVAVYNEQLDFRRLDERFGRLVEQHLIKSYSTLPYNLPELKQLLDKDDIGAEREKRILDAVVAQMKYAVEGATSLTDTPPPLPSMVPTPEPTPAPQK